MLVRLSLRRQALLAGIRILAQRVPVGWAAVIYMARVVHVNVCVCARVDWLAF